MDITNTPHVHVLTPIINKFKSEHEFIITARNFSETVPLLKKKGFEPILIGGHEGKSKLKKINGMFFRLYHLNKAIPRFDISLSLGGVYTSIISKLRSKKAIVFSDNDTSFKVPSYLFGSEFIFPVFFNSDKIARRYRIKKERIHKFNGFKEDIYIASYIPDPSFLNILPFNDFITIRPENLKASYVPVNSKTIVPELFEIFKNYNILYLPRYTEERTYADGYKNIFIPPEPLPGLDVCYYSKAMLTGAGTFAREAALLGTPSVSFFPGKIFLTVDKIMQEKGWEFKSRDVHDIYEYVKSGNKRPNQIENSKKVQSEVFEIFRNIIEKYS